MQVTASKAKGFEPVRIEILCETQAEVNALYFVSNYPVAVAESLADKSSSAGRGRDFPLAGVLDKLYYPLQPHITKE